MKFSQTLVCLTAACSVLAFDLEPGDDAPSFTLKTLEGSVDLSSSMVFYAFDNRSAFLECMWTKNESVDHLIENSTAEVQYVFMSYSKRPQEDVMWMKDRLQSRLSLMHGKAGVGYGTVLKRSHFVVDVAGKTGTWIDWLVRDWTCVDHGCGIDQLNVTAGRGNMSMRRLDARYDWLPGVAVMISNKSVPLVDFGDGCEASNKNLNKNAAVLVSREGPANCTYFTKVKNAYHSNASVVIVFSTPDLPLVDMNCEGSECDHSMNISATMIAYVDGITLQNALHDGNVNVAFATLPSPAFYFGIDAEKKVQQTGWLLYPSFLFLAWQEQWFEYTAELNKNLSKPAGIISVFNHSMMQGHVGATTVMKIPPTKELQMYDDIELDMALSCPGTRDSTCGAWDHVVYLYICCNSSGPYCGQELGRWITPFRRRIGRWLTPIRPLLPFFDAECCNFTMKLDAWWAPKPWVPSLNIRLSDKRNDSQDNSNVTVPYKVLPLFRGGMFNQTYNQHYKPITFTVGSDDIQVKLESVITGHGSDNNNCAEFCVTSHHFVLNGQYKYVQTFSNAGTPLGCARHVLDGVEPNEHGTWLYGRDGWCDGQEVLPWVVDITNHVTQGTNNVTYFGWFNGKDPNPSKNDFPSPPEIFMYSNIIFYKSMSNLS